MPPTNQVDSTLNALLPQPSVQAAASRLRLLQIDLADLPEPQRRQQLNEELVRTVESVPPEQCDAFLNELLKEFPAWGEVVVDPSSAGGASAEQWNDPAALIAQLAVVAGREPARRRDILSRLRPLVGATLSDDSLRQLQRQLSLGEQAPIDPNRATDLVLYLIDFVRRLEAFVNGAWAAMGKGVGGAAPRPLAEAMGRLLVPLDAAQSPAKQDVEAGLTSLDRRCRVLIATMRAFAQQHAEKFAPAEIESMANAGFLSNKPKACWEKYIELCGGSDRDQLEAEISAMYLSIILRIYPEMR